MKKIKADNVTPVGTISRQKATALIAPERPAIDEMKVAMRAVATLDELKCWIDSAEWSRAAELERLAEQMRGILASELATFVGLASVASREQFAAIADA